MARLNGILISYGETLGSDKPIDGREIVEYENDLIDIKQWLFGNKLIAYKGLKTYCLETDKEYRLKEISISDDNTINLNWVEISSGGSGSGVTEEYVNNLVNQEKTTRENVDNVLQSQIDTLESKSDVTDVVTSYVELENYDTTKLVVGDVIIVLIDETKSNSKGYYRWNGATFDYVGSIASSYTKAESDSRFLNKTDYTSPTWDTINPTIPTSALVDMFVEYDDGTTETFQIVKKV